MAKYIITKKPGYNCFHYLYKVHWWGNERIYYGSHDSCLRALKNLKDHGTVEEVLHSESF